MKSKIREILDDCIADGLRSGYTQAYKYEDFPCEETIISAMEYHIWLEIDRKFDFERSVCSEVAEGFDHLAKEEVNRLRAKKKQIYQDLKDAVDREWVGLTYNDIIDTSNEFQVLDKGESEPWFDLIGYTSAIEAKLKEKNA